MAAPVILADILMANAETIGDKSFAHFPEAETWSYRRTLHEAETIRDALAALGVGKGSPVFTWLPNGADLLRFWFGINLLGGIFTPCNLAWRGNMLEHALAISKAKVAVVHCDLLPRLAEIELRHIEHLIIIGGEGRHQSPGVRIWTLDQLLKISRPAPTCRDLHEGSDMQIVFTSGTTGASKAVLGSYRQAAEFLESPLPAALGPDAVFIAVLPLFHAGGLASLYSILLQGGSIVLPGAFRTKEFWPLVEKYQVTSTILVEQMAAFLLAQEPSAGDAETSLKFVNIAPMANTAYRFAERFGVELWTSYGATEVGAPITSVARRDKPGITGRLRPGFEARLVDGNDMPVPTGSIGELVLRSDRPWFLMSGYYGQPEATVSAWRNGWMHTGDMFRVDDEAGFYYVDRRKDCIRRRGENISSQEVEREIASHSAVVEAAVFAVRGESEDEVMACVALADSLTWVELIDYLRARIPHYMVPRYFRRVDRVPRTENGKIQKEGLKGEGITIDTWDREQFGIVIRAERVGAHE